MEEQDRFCSECGAATSQQLRDDRPEARHAGLQPPHRPARTPTQPPQGAVGRDELQSSRADSLSGRTLAGAYDVIELLGVGGMGRVYRAEQTALGRTVAIKVIHPHLLGDDQSVARFYTEARAASRLNHPNSVSIIDFGRTDDGVLYLVMECLQGEDLARLARKNGPLPFLRIVEIMRGVLAALAEAHALGVIHRDLKPENVLIERTRAGKDWVKVVDFGLAKVLSTQPEDSSITRPGLVCGTPDYMSPEQGRGTGLDARSDLYSLGVVIFELLTGTLPYPAPGPTAVVLRHITDPIPDPRDIAPHRDIPHGLNDVVLKAMQKEPEKRFQSAEEMAEALDRISTSLRPLRADELRCPSCRAPNDRSHRYCAECGTPLHGSPPEGVRISRSPQRSVSPAAFVSYNPPPSHDRRLVGRAGCLEVLDALHDAADGGLVLAHLQGEPGAGKSRLLRELAARAADAGDVVVRAGAHETGARVPYAPIRALLSALWDVGLPGLDRLAREDPYLPDLVRAGLQEVLEPIGLRGAERRSRAGAVTAALAAGANVAMGRTSASRVVLLIDDLDRCDGLTLQVLRHFSEAARELSVLVVSAGHGLSMDALPRDAEIIEVGGLSYEEARLLTRGSGSLEHDEALDDEGGDLLPLYVEQLHALGIELPRTADEGPRLADAVTQRVHRLDVDARRVLQAAAVLGTRCDTDALRHVAGAEHMAGLKALQRRGLLRAEDGAFVALPHPFIRELIVASIPAEARKELHERALEQSAAAGEPLEVRAEHACNAQQPFSALMLLERTSDDALKLGDPSTALLGYKRGLDLARRELLESGDVAFDAAIATFSRKLATALRCLDDGAGAEGVLREALGLTAPGSLPRARMLVELAETVAGRGRPSDADRYQDEALKIVRRHDDAQREAEVHRLAARLRRCQKAWKHVIEALARAEKQLERAGAEPLQRAVVALELVEALLDLGDMTGARVQLGAAEPWVEQAEAPYLSARLHALSARCDAQQGEHARAARRYRRAAELGIFAGDAEDAERWQQAARENSRFPEAVASGG